MSDRLDDIIYNKFANSFSICEFCSYTSDKRIKQGNLYPKCITKKCVDIISPYDISLCFELTNIEDDDNNINQFRNLLKYHDNIIKLIKERIYIFNEYYNLCGIIFQEAVNH